MGETRVIESISVVLPRVANEYYQVIFRPWKQGCV